MKVRKEIIYLAVGIVIIALFVFLEREKSKSNERQVYNIDQTEKEIDKEMRWTQEDSKWIEKEWNDQVMGIPYEPPEIGLLDFWF